MSLQHRERLEVARKIEDEIVTDNETFVDDDGQRWEEIVVWNFVNVTMAHQARGSGTIETFKDASSIEIGGGGPQPDYVTKWLAHELWHEFGIDLPSESFNIEVVDIESDEVSSL